VGGIVENYPTAGLATAAHLTLGNHVATRRSGLDVDDCTLNILGDSLRAMHEMAARERSAPWEGPWSSIQGFRMLLTLWKILRMSITQLHNERTSLNIIKYPTHFQPAKTVIEGVISALQLYGNSPAIPSLSTDPNKAADQWED